MSTAFYTNFFYINIFSPNR